MKNVFALLVLLVSGVVDVCAADVTTSNINIKETTHGTLVATSVVKYDAGGTNYEAGDYKVTLTATPSTGYTLTTEKITVQPLLDPTLSPQLSLGSQGRAPGIGIPTLEVTSEGNNTFSFILPKQYGGAYVTATFTLRALKTITSLSEIDDQYGCYEIGSSFTWDERYKDDNGKAIGTSDKPFKGVLDGNFVSFDLGSDPLFEIVDGAIIRNVIISKASVITSGDAGAIACEATGSSRIYNCGILATVVRNTDGDIIGFSGSTVSGGSSGNVGGIVGKLSGTSRVVNCYSYATITGGKIVAGIVGNNTVASSQSNIATMVMNCMFYGDITGGSTVSPVYGGKRISNLNSGGLNNFNYYAYSQLTTKSINEYNCALAIEEKYLDRIEFFRLLLNSNRKLAAYYATGSKDNAGQMAKWVLETADRQNSDPMPYPVLKEQGKYPSIINIDAEHANQLSLTNGKPSEEDRNKGGKLSTLTVYINNVGANAPSGASITTSSLTLNRTDKDFDRYNFNYDKVQLPYYNDVGTKNYTEYKVVTGWKIVSINGGTAGTYETGDKWNGYNFADRNCTNKDLSGTNGSNRVFSQGAYFNVPYGVSSITIEPYWGNAAYVADKYLDVVCKMEQTNRTATTKRNDYVAENVTQLGEQFPDGKITIDGSEQTVYTSISDALATLSSSTVYDNAVVLVGNLHQIGVPSDEDKEFTMMSVDLDEDNEPDCSLIYCDNNRCAVSPIRFDFLNIPGMSQAQKPYDNKTALLNAAIFKTKGWFEVTNTALIYFTQFEYENTEDFTVAKKSAPLIFLGGYIDQFVSTQKNEVTGKTIYIHVGDNLLINSFGLGTHSDGSKKTTHVPVSVTGGDFKEFYLTGTYNQNAAIKDDNAECYISGGRFGELAGAAQEQIGNTNSASNGNVRWQIYDADITEFYGGGVNDAKPVQGNITTEIFNSHVGTFCGGPKFGNMASGKTVTTTAEGCTFTKFFGAGYGGNSFSRKKYFDNTGANWNNLQGYYTTDRGHYFDGSTTNSRDGGNGNDQYGKKGPGVATDFDYEYFVWTHGAVGGRFFVKFASFSLAQCNNVTSTLTDCIIDENFYGGGSRGKVAGTVTSVLDGCTVKGNVFGAGYSGTPDPVPVRSGGFTTNPSFDGNSGMFKPGVLTTTVDFDWMQKSSYPDNGDVGFLNDSGSYDDINGDNVVTKIDITSANLGSVDGDVNLTIKGGSEIGTVNNGSVYGGGDASYVKGADHKITVILQDEGTVVHGNVYGGGNNGLVEGSTEVNIKKE